MSSSCPVCEEPVPEPAVRCDACGFPTALGREATRALSQPEPAPRSEKPRKSMGSMPKSRAGTDAQAELARRVAGTLRAQLLTYERLGGEPGEIISEISQAALTQADGRTAEAVGLLRAAESRVVGQSADLFERRVRDIERRQEALTRDGVGADFRSMVASIRARFESGHREEALSLLLDTDQRLSKIEGDWGGLRSLLQQIDSLREAARASHEEIPDVEEDAIRVRSLLGRPFIDTASIDEAAEVASRALMRLHDRLPGVLEQELDRHSEALESLPTDSETGRRARALHAEASRHLRRGRLADASVRLRELRAVTQALEAEARRSAPAPEPPPAPPPTPLLVAGAPAETPPAAPPSGDPLGRLLTKARGLAARVRSLPPDSEIAFEAAAEIRRATELLRARKLDDAESTLTRLMRTLDSEAIGGDAG